MTADPDTIGPDGRVRLRCYLTSADSLWFAADYQGAKGCGHSAPIGIRAALRFMGPEATVGELERRLRCILTCARPRYRRRRGRGPRHGPGCPARLAAAPLFVTNTVLSAMRDRTEMGHRREYRPMPR